MSLSILSLELKYIIYDLLPAESRRKLSAVNHEWLAIALDVQSHELDVDLLYFRKCVNPYIVTNAPKQLRQLDVVMNRLPRFCATMYRSILARGRWLDNLTSFVYTLANLKSFSISPIGAREEDVIKYLDIGGLVRALSTRPMLVNLEISIPTLADSCHFERPKITNTHHMCHLIRSMIPTLQKLTLRLRSICPEIFLLERREPKQTVQLRSLILHIGVLEGVFEAGVIDEFSLTSSSCTYHLDAFPEKYDDDDMLGGVVFIRAVVRNMQKVCAVAPYLEVARVVRYVHEINEEGGDEIFVLAEDPRNGKQWWIEEEHLENEAHPVDPDDDQYSCRPLRCYHESDAESDVGDYVVSDPLPELSKLSCGDDDDKEGSEAGYDGDGDDDLMVSRVAVAKKAYWETRITQERYPLRSSNGGDLKVVASSHTPLLTNEKSVDEPGKLQQEG